MSLQVWLPLNGNLNNQGLSNITVTNNGATVDNNGKIGKCYSFSSSSSAYLQFPQLSINRSEMSFCIWAKYNGWDNWSRLFDFGATSGSGDTLLLTHSSTSNAFYVGCKTGGIDRDFSYAANLSLNTWYHFAIIKKGLEWKLYLNGSLVYTTNLAGDFSTDPVIFKNNFLGRSNWAGDSYLNGQLNDFRIYDHALSAKEVKELSKGLVLHYKLDNNGMGNPNLAKNGKIIFGTPTGNINGVVSGISEITYYNPIQDNSAPNGYYAGYSYVPSTYQGGCYWGYDRIISGLSALTLNETYTISFYARVTAGESSLFIAPICETQTVVSYTGDTKNGDFLLGQNWKKYTVTFKFTESTKFTVCYYITSSVNTTLQLSSFKLEKGSKATPWCPHTSDAEYNALGYNNNIEYDCSGYGYDGTISGTITTDNTSPRYDTSITFPNGTDYIKSTFTNTMNEFTFSYWIKPSASNGNYSIIGSNYGNDTQCWFAVNTEDSGVWFYTGQYARVSGLLTNGTWYHCVFTFKNGTIKWYINGVEKTLSLNTVTKTSIPFSNFTIGNSYRGSSWNCKNYGSISDVRIYATALSATDVKELYQTSGNIDKNGNLYCYELKEV